MSDDPKVTPLRREVPPEPYNAPIEQDLIGCLFNPLPVAIVVESVKIAASADFGLALHRRIWTAICAAIEAGHPITARTLGPVFAKETALHDLGGAKYLVDLTDSAKVDLDLHGADYALALARQVHNYGVRRRFRIEMEKAAAAARLDLDVPNSGASSEDNTT